jgi:1-deoxy-D-xylulose-5-phosphate synthase
MHDNTVFNTIPDQRPDTPLLDRVETPEQLREVIRRDQLVPPGT